MSPELSTSKPVAGAEVLLQTYRPGWGYESVQRPETDGLGFVQIERIPKETYRVWGVKEGYTPRIVGYFKNRGNSFASFDIFLAREGSVSGTVTDVLGKPLKGAEVHVLENLGMDGLGHDWDFNPKTKTDDQGRFKLNGLPQGYTWLRCSCPPLWQRDRMQIYKVPSEYVKIVMEPTGVIRGQVVEEGGKPIAEPTPVDVVPLGDFFGKWMSPSRPCGSKGEFEYTGVPPGEYLIGTNLAWWAKFPGIGKYVKSVTVEAGKTVNVEIVRDPKTPHLANPPR